MELAPALQILVDAVEKLAKDPASKDSNRIGVLPVTDVEHNQTKTLTHTLWGLFQVDQHLHSRGRLAICRGLHMTTETQRKTCDPAYTIIGQSYDSSHTHHLKRAHMEGLDAVMGMLRDSVW